MRISLPPIALPTELVLTAAEYAAGRRTPVEPRDAATVVLARAGAGGPELYLLNRHRSMAFAAGATVFPGGGVDPRDAAEETPWAGPAPQEWADRLGCDAARARALVCAAVRETFEECGVLLAGASAAEVVADVSGPDWEADRVALETRAISLSELLARRGLVLRSDLLGAWDGWTTPAFEGKRYRTWFFVAALPEGQVTRDVSSESVSVLWMPAAEAVVAAEEGRLFLMPPTYLTCLEVAEYAGPAELLVPMGHRGFSNQGASLSARKVAGGEHRKVAVRAARLDDLGIAGVGFIKIDVEGFELQVLAGAAETLRRDRPNLLVEMEERHTSLPLPEMVRQVTARGYDAFALAGGVLTAFARLDLEKHHATPGSADYINNFIFLPR